MELLAGLEREQNPLHFIPYERYSQWGACLPLFSRAGLIHASSIIAKTTLCAECQSNVTVQIDSRKYLVQCFSCELVRQLSKEEVTLYETTLDHIAHFVRSNLPLAGAVRTILAGQLIQVGKHSADNGEYMVWVAKGLSKDTESIYTHCQPPNARTHSLILSTCCQALPTGKNRMVQVPLIDLLGFEGDRLVLRHEQLPLKLVGVYVDAKGAAREEGRKQFINYFSTAIATGKVQDGEREKWRAIAEADFGVGVRDFRTIWGKLTPASFKHAGRRSKKARHSSN